MEYSKRECGAEELGRRALSLVGRPERELASHGAIRIMKDTGLFIARK